MNAQPQPNNPQETFELRLRTMRTLWIAMILSIAAYFAFSLFVGRLAHLEPNPALSLVMLAGAVASVLISFPIKSKLLNRAIEQQRVQMVQQAYIVAWAISEVAALLGLLDFFTTGDRYYYVLLIIAAVGQLLHAPRREHIVNASGATPIF
jgi:hypothetical protein